MNKQEVIDEIEKIDYQNLKYNSPERMLFAQKQLIIDIIERLDKPQKVKVPAFVAELLDYYRNSTDVDLLALLICFKDWYFRKDKTSEYEEAINWLVTHPEQFMKAWLDGYKVEESKWAVKEGDLVIRKGCHEAKIYFVESVDEDGILLVNGVKDEFFTDGPERAADEETLSYFYGNFRLLAKKENLEAEKV